MTARQSSSGFASSWFMDLAHTGAAATVTSFGRSVRMLLDGLYLVAGGIAACFLVAILVLVATQIVARALSISFPGATDYAGYCMAGASFFALAHTFRAGAHIRVSIVLQGLPVAFEALGRTPVHGDCRRARLVFRLVRDQGRPGVTDAERHLAGAGCDADLDPAARDGGGERCFSPLPSRTSSCACSPVLTRSSAQAPPRLRP